MPALTPGELNRATLARQLLLRREASTVPDAVRRVVALQAQHPASPYLALWSTAAGVAASAFRPLPADVWEALSAEARSLGALLAGRGDPDVYARHAHWWAKLPPAAETRLLGGDGHG